MNKETKELIKQELEALKDEQGVVHPGDVVDFAIAHPESECHKHGFNWNVQEAARAYWLHQARYLIATCIVVTYEKGSEQGTEIRAFFREGKEENQERASGYVSTETMLQDSDHRRKVIVTVIKRVLGVLNSYPLPELKPLVTLANKLLTKYRQAEKEAEVS